MKFQIPAFVAAEENKIFKGSNWFIVKKSFKLLHIRPSFLLSTAFKVKQKET
jgi:hypothetical protein